MKLFRGRTSSFFIRDEIGNTKDDAKRINHGIGIVGTGEIVFD